METKKKDHTRVTKADLKTRKDPYTVTDYNKDDCTFTTKPRIQSKNSVFEDYAPYSPHRPTNVGLF